MISFRVLGPLDLRSADAAPVTSVLTQPKRLALLAYLAIATPHGFHRRDTLVGLFWGDLDQERARGSLRKALFHLRQALGADALVSRGDEEIGLAADVWCDAAALHTAYDDQDYETVFDLYRGPLLAGFFVRDAPAFEEWLELERARVASLAFKAAVALADREEQRADDFAAAHWARNALKLLPTDETALRKLLTLLERVDDRSAALAAYEDFAARLSAEFGAEPSATTKAIVARIRQRSEDLRQAPQPEFAAPSSDQPLRPRTQGHSRRRLAIAVVTALALFGGMQVIRRGATPATASVTGIGVLPFTFRGDVQHAHLASGMASLLATNLDGADVSEQTGLNRYVRGEVVEAGGQLRVRATLYGRHGKVLARSSAQGSSNDLFTLVDRIAMQLVAGEAGLDDNIALAARTTHSLPALKAYLQGEAQFRSGHYANAVAAYQRAIVEDSTFALAYYRLAASYGWTSDSLALPTARLAVRHGKRLGVADRELLEALVPFYEGRADEAERRYRAILQRFPFEGEAWFPLGDLLFHFNPVRGQSITESRQALEYALKHGPRDGPLTHLLEVVAIEGDYEVFARLFREIEPGAHFDLAGRTVRAFTVGSEAERRDILAELDTVPVRNLSEVARHVPFLIRDASAGSRVLRHIAQAPRPQELRALAHILLAHLEAGAGRMRAADAELARAASFDRTRALEHRAFLHTLPFRSAVNQPDALATVLARWESKAGAAASVIFPADEDLHGVFMTYLRGLLAAQSGLVTEARSQAGVLATAQFADDAAAQLAGNLALGIEARAAWQRGDVAGTLAFLERTITERGAADLMGMIPFFSLPQERYLRAQALQRSGRLQEALGWYASFAEHSPFGRAFRAPASLQQARIHEALGQPAMAAPLYRDFIEAWRDCDPELEPEVERAAASLARLQTVAMQTVPNRERRRDGR